jgi:glycine C-acetyltransferase
MEDCILFPSGFDANAGFFEAIFGEQDAIISDALNHASIIDGIRLTKSIRKRYKHLDMADLETALK